MDEHEIALRDPYTAEDERDDLQCGSIFYDDESEIMRLARGSKKPLGSRDTRTKAPSKWKWICFEKDCGIDYRTRLVFAKYCHIWFVPPAKGEQRVYPSLNHLRKATGFRLNTLKACLNTLRLHGLLVTPKQGPYDQPAVVDGILMPTAKFDESRWWKTVQSRNVEPTLHDAADVVLAIIKYRNLKNKSVTTEYVRKTMGIKDASTIRRYIIELVKAKRLRRDADNDDNLLWIESEGNRTFTASENALRMAHRKLETCVDMDQRRRLATYCVRKPQLFDYLLDQCAKQNAGKVNWHQLENMLKMKITA